MAFVQLLRPHQWVKNVFIFAGLVFGQKLFDPGAVTKAMLGFLLLSLVSSTIYIFNDIHDRAEDRLHPSKKNRPIAAGRVSVRTAILLGLATFVIGLGGSYLLDHGFFLVALAYLLLQTLYTLVLKHMVILDVISIGIGFVLRAVAGAVLVDVEISHWLVICTFTLCLFMGFSKRRCELNVLGSDAEAGKHRKTLQVYTRDLLNQMTTLTAGIAVISFMLYATDERTMSEFGTKQPVLVYTLPLVVYAVFRFALLVEHGRVGGPTDVLLRDRPFQVAMVLWAGLAMLLVYRGPEIESWLGAFMGSG